MAKIEKAIEDRFDHLVKDAAKAGIYIGSCVLYKSRNKWSFSGNRAIVDALTSVYNVLLLALENEADNVGIDKKDDRVVMNDSNFSMDICLPPMPNKLAKLSCESIRSYISRGLSIITVIKDSRKLYKQERPRWWLEKIPFVKPGVVPTSYQEKYGNLASSKWHDALCAVFFMMHKETSQDYRKNVDEDMWDRFCKKFVQMKQVVGKNIQGWLSNTSKSI